MSIKYCGCGWVIVGMVGDPKRMIERLSIAVGAWVLVMSPAILHAGHHPRHTGTPAALWIFLVIIAFVGIMGWLTRKKK